MAGNIPRNFIDDLLDRVDIVELIDSRVKLKKSGKNYSACCPFHDEKTPSFTVSPDKQFYYCFGCGATGNAIGFLMEYERTSFPESIESIAKLVGVEVPREESSDPKQREQEQAQEKARKTLYDLLEQSDRFYQQQLREHAQKDRAVSYLKRRGLSGQIAKAFGIGYAPPGWENLSKTIGTSNEKQDRLLEAGMLIYNEDSERLYDRFRDRVTFPIRDVRGRVIGFGGRVLTDEKPKYLNSPETPIFHKGKELYGLFEARQAYKQLPRLLVVEGYMDVVSLAQYGIHYGVATLGTACSEDHLHRGFRFTNEIVFCFDGDEAGRKAAKRAMEASLSVMEDGRQVKFLYLPEGEDPDTLIRHIGTDKFTRLIEGAAPLEHFLFDELGQEVDMNTMEGRARLCKQAAPLLNQLPNGVYRELMFQQLANRTQLSKDALLRLLEETHAPAKPPVQKSLEDKPAPQKIPQRPAFSPEKQQETAPRASAPKSLSTLPPDELALSLLLYQPSLAQNVGDFSELNLSDNNNIKLLAELIEFLQQKNHYTSGQVLGHWQGTYGMEKSQPLRLFLSKGVLFHHARNITKEAEKQFDPEKEFTDALNHLQTQLAINDCENIIKRLNAKNPSELTGAERQLYLKAITARGQVKH